MGMRLVELYSEKYIANWTGQVLLFNKIDNKLFSGRWKKKS